MRVANSRQTALLEALWQRGHTQGSDERRQGWLCTGEAHSPALLLTSCKMRGLRVTMPDPRGRKSLSERERGRGRIINTKLSGIKGMKRQEIKTREHTLDKIGAVKDKKKDKATVKEKERKRRKKQGECSIIHYTQCPFPRCVPSGKFMGTGEFHASDLSHSKSNVTKSFSLIIRALKINSSTPTLTVMGKIHPKIEFTDVTDTIFYTSVLF